MKRLIFLMCSICMISLFWLGCSTPTAHDGTVKLRWTAPGDDGYVGTATTYDLRYHTEPITVGNWFDATQASGVPAPQIAGSIENYTVSGLTIGVTYYFAIRTADEKPNWSVISNVAEEDGVPPGAITLEVVP